nr:hypothetical protein [uncultured Rhodopila sp.]
MTVRAEAVRQNPSPRDALSWYAWGQARLAGDANRTQANADAQFATLPANQRNRLVHVAGPHPATPDAAVVPALEWLKPL